MAELAGAFVTARRANSETQEGGFPMALWVHAGAPRRFLVAGVALIGAVGLAWVATAAADGGVIHACYQKNQGQLRIVAVGASCRPDEIPTSWNIQGPSGPQGPQGPSGPQGPAGISGLERVDFSSHSDSLSPKSAFAKCPTGKHAVGCGAEVFMAGGPSGPVAVKKSKPSDDMTGCAATAEEMMPTDANWFVTSYALCGTVSP
jgi:hypothetical protein